MWIIMAFYLNTKNRTGKQALANESLPFSV